MKIFLIAWDHDLMEETGVNLQVVVNWSFEFEDQPWFAGFRDPAIAPYTGQCGRVRSGAAPLRSNLTSRIFVDQPTAAGKSEVQQQWQATTGQRGVVSANGENDGLVKMGC